MMDEGIVTRDPQHTSDDTWSDVTGTYTKPANDEDTIYSGKCMIAFQNPYGGEKEEGGAYYEAASYSLAIPLDAQADIRPNDLFTVTAVGINGDASMVGKEFIIDNILVGTFPTSQRFTMHRLERSTRV